MSAGAVTHPGLVRTSNEDSLVVTERLVAVADGLGGHAAGEIASQLAVERMRDLARQADITPDDVTFAIADANRLILQAGRERPDRAGLGTTLCGMAVVRAGGTEHCLVFNVGDSRVYRSVAGALEQVTVDHSEVQELADAGRISPQAARRHPRRNVVTRCLGSDPTPPPDVWVFPPAGPERYVVCSDGLTNEVDDDVIRQLLDQHPEPGPAASALLEQALSAGGRDNIAVIVVNLDGSADAGQIATDTAPRARSGQR
jgi:protein phosphatase